MNTATIVNMKPVISQAVDDTRIHPSVELAEVKPLELADASVIRERSLTQKALHLTEMNTGKVEDYRLMSLVEIWEMLLLTQRDIGPD